MPLIPFDVTLFFIVSVGTMGLAWAAGRIESMVVSVLTFILSGMIAAVLYAFVFTLGPV